MGSFRLKWIKIQKSRGQGEEGGAEKRVERKEKGIEREAAFTPQLMCCRADCLAGVFQCEGAITCRFLALVERCGGKETDPSL